MTPVDEASRAYGKRALRVCALSIPVVLLGFGTAIVTLHLSLNPWLVVVGIILGLAATVFAAYTGSVAIAELTDTAPPRIRLATVRPLFFVILPFAGVVIAILKAIPLLRGRLKPLTILQSSGGTVAYPASELGRSGVPLGLLLLVLAGFHAAVIGVIGIEISTVDSEEAAAVMQEPPSDPSAVREHVGHYAGRRACKLALACYEKHGFSGDVAGRVTFEVDLHGQVSSVLAQLPDTPEPIVGCIEACCREESLIGPVVAPGRWVCDFAGNLSDASREVDSQPRFFPRAEQGER